MSCLVHKCQGTTDGATGTYQSGVVRLGIGQDPQGQKAPKCQSIGVYKHLVLPLDDFLFKHQS